ncbi:MAG: hypothetical protein M1824_000930 [Vezdaea acicularis]|nr:MAG: hypothetical protein M1824_000930 [Vezdaea acicularis]
MEEPYELPPSDNEDYVMDILRDYGYHFDPLIQDMPEPRNSDLGRNPRSAGKDEAKAYRKTREVAECKPLSRRRKRKDDDKGKTCESWERLNKLGSIGGTLLASNVR